MSTPRRRGLPCAAPRIVIRAPPETGADLENDVVTTDHRDDEAGRFEPGQVIRLLLFGSLTRDRCNKGVTAARARL